MDNPATDPAVEKMCDRQGAVDRQSHDREQRPFVSLGEDCSASTLAWIYMDVQSF